MLDDDDRVAAIHKFLEYIHQDADILEMQSCRWLVEDIQGLTRILLREFGGELYALALTAGEGGGGLA